MGGANVLIFWLLCVLLQDALNTLNDVIQILRSCSKNIEVRNTTLRTQRRHTLLLYANLKANIYMTVT